MEGLSVILQVWDLICESRSGVWKSYVFKESNFHEPSSIATGTKHKYCSLHGDIISTFHDENFYVVIILWMTL